MGVKADSWHKTKRKVNTKSADWSKVCKKSQQNRKEYIMYSYNWSIQKRKVEEWVRNIF